MSSKIQRMERMATQGENPKLQTSACCRLAKAYSAGDGVEKDASLAVKWWLKASELGHQNLKLSSQTATHRAMGSHRVTQRHSSGSRRLPIKSLSGRSSASESSTMKARESSKAMKRQ